jgi:hypothetical protein
MIEDLIKKWIPTFLAIITCAFVLAGYLMPEGPMVYFRDRLVEWAVIVSVFALLLGLFNILRVHGRRVRRLREDWLYSLVLLLAVVVSFVLTLLSRRATQWMFEYVVKPVGASLAALVVFTLALAAFRLLRARRSAEAIIFAVVVAIVLIGTVPPKGLEKWIPLSDIRNWLVNVLGMAGMRGLLLGVALGTVITALRVLASDRPHSEF